MNLDEVFMSAMIEKLAACGAKKPKAKKMAKVAGCASDMVKKKVKAKMCAKKPC